MSAGRNGGLTGTLALIIGIALAIAGLFLVLIYMVGVVDILVNQPPDQSWLFWGLGVAFIGVTLLAGGIVLLVVWWRSRPDSNRD